MRGLQAPCWLTNANPDSQITNGASCATSQNVVFTHNITCSGLSMKGNEHPQQLVFDTAM